MPSWLNLKQNWLNVPWQSRNKDSPSSLWLGHVWGGNWVFGKSENFWRKKIKGIQNLKCEDRRFQNCLVLKTEDLMTKPTKPEDWKFEFLTGKMWLLSVINWEDGS